MYKIQTSVSALNDLNSSHLHEKNWKLAENGRRGNYERHQEDGFYFHMETEEITLWNGKERIYFPFFGAFYDRSVQKTSKEIMEKIMDSKDAKNVYELMPAGIFSSFEQFVKLIAPFMLSKIFNFRTTLSVFLCGDFKDGKVINLSASNYFTSSMINDGKAGDNKVMCYYAEETEESNEIDQVIENTISSGVELYNYYMKRLRQN